MKTVGKNSYSTAELVLPEISFVFEKGMFFCQDYNISDTSRLVFRF